MAQRGRPKGSGHDFSGVLHAMALAICEGRANSIRAAARAVTGDPKGRDDKGESRNLRRLYAKERVEREIAAMETLDPPEMSGYTETTAAVPNRRHEAMPPRTDGTSRRRDLFSAIQGVS